MNELTVTSAQETMTSLELRDLINEVRKDFGEKPVRNDQFLARIEDELEGELGGCKTFAPAQGGTPMKYYGLTRDQCTLVGMRESKGVRRIVLEKLKAVERVNLSPTIKDPQLAAMVTMLTQLDVVKQEQAAQRSEMAEIRAKLTATPDEYYTVAGYASLRGISLDTKRANLLGRKAAKVSREHGVDIGKAHSAIYGEVNTYHVDVLCEVFG